MRGTSSTNTPSARISQTAGRHLSRRTREYSEPQGVNDHAERASCPNRKTSARGSQSSYETGCCARHTDRERPERMRSAKRFGVSRPDLSAFLTTLARRRSRRPLFPCSPSLPWFPFLLACRSRVIRGEHVVVRVQQEKTKPGRVGRPAGVDYGLSGRIYGISENASTVATVCSPTPWLSQIGQYNRIGSTTSPGA